MRPLAEAEIESLAYPNETHSALSDIDLKIYPGRLIVLDGPSESGKSTLCRCLAGVIPHFEQARLCGRVMFEGVDVAGMRLPELAGKIGFVRDEPDNQLFSTTVEEDLAFGPCNLLVQADEIERRVGRALKMVGLDGYQHRRIETLSGGEMGRAALAAMLTLNPRFVVLDRAADMFDPAGRAEIYARLKTLCRTSNAAVLVVDNKADDIIPESDRVLLMEAGSIVFDGKPIQYKERVNSVRRRHIPQMSHLRSIAPAPVMMRPAKPEAQVHEHQHAGPAIRVRNVSFSYESGHFSLKDLSLDIHEGEFVAVLGNNGAGKTTLVKLFNGLLTPQSGTVLVNGLDTTLHSTAEISTHVGFLSQHPSLQICTNSVHEEVGFALKVRGVRTTEANKRIAETLRRFQLTDVSGEHPYRLSRSLLQRVALASCMITEPSVLVADEPTSRMTYPHNRDTLDLIAQYNHEGGTVVMVVHDLEAADHFSSRTVVMEEGEIVSEVTKQSESSPRYRSSTR